MGVFEYQSMAEQREVFTSLVLPEFDQQNTFYLGNARGLELSAKSFIDYFNLKPDQHFQDHEDFMRAIRSNSVWSWDVRSNSSNNEDVILIRAASSLPLLLGGLGEPDTQGVACELWQSLYPSATIAFKDYRPAGWDTVKQFLSDSFHKDANLFFASLEERRIAEEQDVLWSVVENSETLYASPTLKGLLEVAWDRHPTVRLRMELETTAAVNHPRVNSGPRL